MVRIEDYFGKEFTSVDARLKSYDFLETFISEHYLDESVPPNTRIIVQNFIATLKSLSDCRFSFLLFHSGYIPESYLPDSSKETLYSKLIESLVHEWAIRFGFNHSQLPTQKSSTEDITICDGSVVIVCDAKSFRLGRSQGAPNVKDVLKHSDIRKWLDAHNHLDQLGGLVSFPSQHDWKRGSDFYQYTTDKDLPTIALYYEHMAFFLIMGITKDKLIDTYKNYGAIFPHKINKEDNNRSAYYNQIEENLFSDHCQSWNEYRKVAHSLIKELVFHTSENLDKTISRRHQEIQNKYSKEMDIEVLRKKAIDEDFFKSTEALSKQRQRISNFRDRASEYHEE
tara:strand:+ start:685 stop:1704 length:1020 start_codon:yes stop_codon:yes gene_type:complete